MDQSVFTKAIDGQLEQQALWLSHTESVVEKARLLMERENIDAIVASTAENFYYLAGFASFFIYTRRVAGTALAVSRNEEYMSYLVMTQKKTNTLLSLEDTQWLNLIISYLAVSLENVHLNRKLTMIASHRDLLHRVKMNTINDGVIITDNKGIIVELNQLIERITNCKKEQVLNESVFIRSN